MIFVQSDNLRNPSIGIQVEYTEPEVQERTQIPIQPSFTNACLEYGLQGLNILTIPTFPFHLGDLPWVFFKFRQQYLLCYISLPFISKQG